MLNLAPFLLGERSWSFQVWVSLLELAIERFVGKKDLQETGLLACPQAYPSQDHAPMLLP